MDAGCEQRQAQDQSVPLSRMPECITQLQTYSTDTITITTASALYKIASSGDVYQAPTDDVGRIVSMAHMDCNTVWLAADKSLYLYDFRADRRVEYKNIAADVIYRVSRAGARSIITCQSYSENVIAVLDARNPYQPLQLYAHHSHFISRVFPFAESFYSADEGGNIYKFGYASDRIINRVKFNQNQDVIDLDYSYSKDYFLVLLEHNILKQTEAEVIDNIRNDQPFHSVALSNDGTKSIFANNAEVIFCDEQCEDVQEYVKCDDSDCQVRPFREGCLFTDGSLLLYNALSY